MPSKIGEWTDFNEGGKKFGLTLELSDETQTILEDREETMALRWRVVSVRKREIVWSQRLLAASEGPELQEVKELDIQLEFSYPEYISQGIKAKDRVHFKA